MATLVWTRDHITIFINCIKLNKIVIIIIIFTHREMCILRLDRLQIFIGCFWFIHSRGRSNTLIVTWNDVHPTVGPIVGLIVGPIVGSSKHAFDYRSDRSVRQFDRINVRPTVGPIVGPIIGPTIGPCKRHIILTSWGHVGLYTHLLKAYTHFSMGIICQINSLLTDMYLFIYDYSTE